MIHSTDACMTNLNLRNSISHAQIKILDDNHVSLGSLTKGGGLQMQPKGYIYHQPTYTASWALYSKTYALNPYSKIHIVDYNGQTRYFVLGNGQVYSNGSYYFSDAVLKENIEEIDSPLEKLILLSGVRFDFIKEYQDTVTFVDENGEEQLIIPPNPYQDDLVDNEYVLEAAKPAIIAERNRKHFGFIAQEVEQVFPEAVRTTPEGKKALAYHELLAVCVEAIKELEQKTSLSENLQNNVILLTQLTNDQQNQINELKQNTMLEKTVNIDNNNIGSKSDDVVKLFQNIPNPY